jgi:excinuclease UvrABC ATPase subunit
VNGGNVHTLDVLDEPTIDLHIADVGCLVRVLHQLVDAGGKILAAGSPTEVADAGGSGACGIFHTARFLRTFLARAR